MRKFIILILFLVCGPSAVLLAQDVKAEAKLDSNAILIGQQVQLRLSVHYRADNGKHISIAWPAIADTIRKEIEVVSAGKTDTIISKDDPLNIVQSRTLILTSFDSGYWAIPPFHFSIAGDSTDVSTEPLLLQVTPVAVDTTAAIRDIKGPMGETYTWRDWLRDNQKLVWICVAILVVFLLLIYFLVRYLNRPKPVVVVEKPKIPPHVTALQKLDELEKQKLWQEGKLKQYYSELTDIMREYIEGRFRITALEQTTDEIIYGFRNIAIDEESKSRLRNVLVLADLVKFAKETPLANENENSLADTRKFIEGTMRDENQTDKNAAAKNV